MAVPEVLVVLRTIRCAQQSTFNVTAWLIAMTSPTSSTDIISGLQGGTA